LVAALSAPPPRSGRSGPAPRAPAKVERCLLDLRGCSSWVQVCAGVHVSRMSRSLISYGVSSPWSTTFTGSFTTSLAKTPALLDQPVQHRSCPVSGIPDKPLRLKAEALLCSLDHGLCCADLGLPTGAGGLDVNDNAELHIDERVTRLVRPWRGMCLTAASSSAALCRHDCNLGWAVVVRVSTPALLYPRKDRAPTARYRARNSPKS